MHHDYKTSTDCGCANPCCIICVGGLAVCKICGLFEGSLTTDCPGQECWRDRHQDIYAGRIDFRAGQWVDEVSVHSPAHFAEIQRNPDSPTGQANV